MRAQGKSIAAAECSCSTWGPNSPAGGGMLRNELFAISGLKRADRSRRVQLLNMRPQQPSWRGDVEKGALCELRAKASGLQPQSAVAKHGAPTAQLAGAC